MKKQSFIFASALGLILFAFTVSGFSCQKQNDDQENQNENNITADNDEIDAKPSQDETITSKTPAYVGKWQRTIIYENNKPLAEADAILDITSETTFNSTGSCKASGIVINHGDNSFTLQPTFSTCPGTNEKVKYSYEIFFEEGVEKMKITTYDYDPIIISEDYKRLSSK
jgi:hypothetical protein